MLCAQDLQEQEKVKIPIHFSQQGWEMTTNMSLLHSQHKQEPIKPKTQ
jgi:hypothetical protein